MMTGLILAGGAGRTADGVNKALQAFGGELLLHRQIRELRRSCPEIIIVTEEPKPFLRLVDPEVRIITDYYGGRGPLGGIHAGLSLAQNNSVWVVGCTMPFVSAEAALLLDRLRRDGAEAAVPVIGGKAVALHGVYGKGCAAEALQLLERGESRASALLDSLVWKAADEPIFAAAGIDLRFALNIGTEAQYLEALQQAENLQ